jgi:hypothetical protein
MLQSKEAIKLMVLVSETGDGGFVEDDLAIEQFGNSIKFGYLNAHYTYF